jgi:hypothetical protein
MRKAEGGFGNAEQPIVACGSRSLSRPHPAPLPQEREQAAELGRCARLRRKPNRECGEPKLINAETKMENVRSREAEILTTDCRTNAGRASEENLHLSSLKFAYSHLSSLNGKKMFEALWRPRPGREGVIKCGCAERGCRLKPAFRCGRNAGFSRQLRTHFQSHPGRERAENKDCERSGLC